MAKVEFTINRQLPAVCVVCGNQGTSFVPHSFKYDEPSAVASQVAVYILYVIVGIMIGSRNPGRSYRGIYVAKTCVEVNVPFCEGHSTYFGRGKKLSLAFFGIAATPWAVWGSLSFWFPKFSFDIEYALMAFVGLLLVWLAVFFYSEFTSLRVSKRTAGTFVLHGVCRAFVAKCEKGVTHDHLP